MPRVVAMLVRVARVGPEILFHKVFWPTRAKNRVLTFKVNVGFGKQLFHDASRTGRGTPVLFEAPFGFRPLGYNVN